MNLGLHNTGLVSLAGGSVITGLYVIVIVVSLIVGM